MNIAVDLDDFLADLISELINVYNRKYNTNATKEDVCNWGFFLPEIHEEFKTSGGYRRLKSAPGAKDIISWLRTIGQVSIITIRSDDYRQDTYKWLEEKLPGLYEPENVHFTNGPKLDACQELGIELLIDDSVNHTRQVAENLGIYTILYNNGTPMFRNAEKHPKIYQAKNMDEVKKYVLEIKSILSQEPE